MINVSTYWTLPPSRQGNVRAKIEKEEQEMHRVIGYYYIIGECFDTSLGGVCMEFSLYCSKCYRSRKRELDEEYTPVTKEEYINPKHDMHGEACDQCNKVLA